MVLDHLPGNAPSKVHQARWGISLNDKVFGVWKMVLIERPLWLFTGRGDLIRVPLQVKQYGILLGTGNEVVSYFHAGALKRSLTSRRDTHFLTHSEDYLSVFVEVKTTKRMERPS